MVFVNRRNQIKSKIPYYNIFFTAGLDDLRKACYTLVIMMMF